VPEIVTKVGSASKEFWSSQTLRNSTRVASVKQKEVNTKLETCS